MFILICVTKSPYLNFWLVDKSPLGVIVDNKLFLVVCLHATKAKFSAASIAQTEEATFIVRKSASPLLKV